MITQVFTGHTNEDNSYLVLDYPYGRKLKCKIRYWLEYDDKKGFRFCSQIENPKNGIWNNPKKSTYCKVAMCMYLDERGYVMHSAVSEYTDEKEVLQFIKNFRPLDENNWRSLTVWCQLKVSYWKRFVSGENYFQINGQKKEASPVEIERYKEELKVWEECVSLLKVANG